MTLKILATAMDDLHDGHAFYERQAPGLGTHFFHCIFSDIDTLQTNGGIHPVVYGFHRMLSKRFPYAVYYAVEGDVVVVRRVLDTRQNPILTQQALQRKTD